MKTLSLAIALAACMPVFSQDQAVQFQAFHASNGIRIEGTLNNARLAGTTMTIHREDSQHIFRLRGNVGLTIDGVRVHADEVVLHVDSGEIEPSGNVQLMVVR